ncbi:unnamed protein product [Camellia sinensis]
MDSEGDDSNSPTFHGNYDSKGADSNSPTFHGIVKKDDVMEKTVLNVAEIDGGLLGPIGPLGFSIYDDLLGPPIDGVYPGLLVVPISPPELDFGLLDAPNDPPTFEKIMKNWALSEARASAGLPDIPIDPPAYVAEINGGLLDPIGPLGFGVYTDVLGPPIDGVYAGLLVASISPLELG